MSKPVIIIGAGVNGVTTALLMQLLGYSTRIYTAARIKKSFGSGDPSFASLFPSASIIPHSVFTEQQESLFTESQSIFYSLLKQSFPGLSVHNHFEVFEFEPIQPDYLKWMHNSICIGDLDRHDIPRRSDETNLFGWSFDCIFADWPVYFPALVELYKKKGGEFIIQKLKPKDIATLPASIIINCSGTGSLSLFDDPVKPLLMRGHLAHIKAAPPLYNAENECISYNYTPGAAEYCTPAGEACDVYLYPRKDGWILGGSRQCGLLSETGEWQGENTKEPFYEMNGIRFPSQIIDINKQVVEHSFGVDFNEINAFSPMVGYRYIRSKNNGLRLSKESVSDKVVYHNYGHGGAGVTLSWGCALELASTITELEPTEVHNQMLKRILT